MDVNVDALDDVSPEQAWAAAVAALVAVFGIGSVVFPRAIYANFVWRYFWGPVYADAKGWSCAAWSNGNPVEPASCSLSAQQLAEVGPVAEPGYTVVSEIGYVVVLLVALVGVMFLLQRLRVSRYRSLFFALFPYMLLGGALRVVEDANNAAVREGFSQAFGYPANTLLISPLIYFTVFFLTVATLVVAVALDRRGTVDRYETPLFAAGSLYLAATVLTLFYLSTSTAYVEFHPQILAVVLVGATAVTAVTWVAVERFAPAINAGTERMGLVIVWGHAIDGVANVVGLDWGKELGLAGDLYPKHPVNRAVIDVTQAVVPASVIAVIGDAWGFLLLKMVAVVFILWVFNEEVFEESPRYTVVLLVAVLAVGLGPGTRDMLRATFGV